MMLWGRKTESRKTFFIGVVSKNTNALSMSNKVRRDVVKKHHGFILPQAYTKMLEYPHHHSKSYD